MASRFPAARLRWAAEEALRIDPRLGSVVGGREVRDSGVMFALQSQIHELHDATDELVAAWDALTQAVARRLEGIWDDDPARITDARRRVRMATGAANAALDRALAEGGA